MFACPRPSPAAALVTLCLTACLTACGGGGDGGGDGNTPVQPTQAANPSNSATALVVALPNAAQLATAGFTQGSDNSFTFSVAGTSYTLDEELNATIPAGARTFGAEEPMVMVCTSARNFVVSNPYLSTSQPLRTLTAALPAEIAGRTFALVDGCSLDESDTVRFNADGSAQGVDDALSKAEVDAYFSTAGLREGNELYRGHIYKLQEGALSYYVIVETYRESNGTEGVLLLVEQGS